MTRPTENQLAELAANLRGKDWNLRAPQELADMIADKLDGIVAAYRSAQQAEAGAAADGFEEKCERNARVQSRYDELMREGKHGHYETMFRVVHEEFERGRQQGPSDGMKQAIVTTVNEAVDAAFERGRQQGMEQAKAELFPGMTPHQFGYALSCARAVDKANAERDEALAKLAAASSAQSSKPEPQSSRVGVLDKAASSAQEPGWVMVPVEPTREMWAAVNKLDDEMAAGSYDGKGCSIEQAWECLIANAPAAPARLAGAAQGEAEPIGWMTPTEFKNMRKAYECHDNRAFIIRPRREPDLIPTIPLYAHPQAQVERKPLSDEQRRQMWRNSEFRGNGGQIDWFIEGTRAAERYHGIPTASTASDEGVV